MELENHRTKLLIWGVGKRSEKASALIDNEKYNV